MKTLYDWPRPHLPHSHHLDHPVKLLITKKNKKKQTKNKKKGNFTIPQNSLKSFFSAPEILLSVIEICGSKFVAGDLGPGTIVGSAAFNLFVIIGICILVIPDGEVRYQKHLPVFFCTATW